LRLDHPSAGRGGKIRKKMILPVEAGMPSDERSELMIDQP
jgi:hypothetical protein